MPGPEGVRLYTTEGKRIASFKLRGAGPLAYSREGLLAVGTYDGKVEVWDSARHVRMHQFDAGPFPPLNSRNPWGYSQAGMACANAAC